MARRRVALAAMLTAAVAACGPGGEDRADQSGRLGADTVPLVRLPPDSAPAAGDAAPGAVLYAELGCGACHAGRGGGRARGAPALAELGARSGPWLLAFLRAPRRLRPGIGAARMPGFHLDAAEAYALARYLAGLSPPGDEPTGPLPGPAITPALADSMEAAWDAAGRAFPDVDEETGRLVFGALGCAGCHPAATAGTGGHDAVAPPLDGVSRRLRPAWLREYLAGPRAVRPYGYRPGSGSRMPEFRLASAETDSLARFLLGREPAGAGTGAAAMDPGALTAHGRSVALEVLRDQLACLGCHAWEGEGGRLAPDLADAAARLPTGHLRRAVLDPHGAAPGTLMPRPLETPARLRPVLALLATPGEDGGGAGSGSPGPAPRSGYPSLVELAPWLAAMEPESGYAGPDAPIDAAGDAAGDTVTAVRPDGAVLYGRYCAHCHGVRGAGDGYNAPFLPVRPTAHADSAAMSDRPDDVLFDGIHAGGHILGRSHRMPGFGGSLTSVEVRALVDRIRELCECRGPAWSRDGVGP